MFLLFILAVALFLRSGAVWAAAQTGGTSSSPRGASLTPITDDESVVRPWLDAREFHSVVLENGMRVMLISAASEGEVTPMYHVGVRVGVGSMHSPARLQGLAHLLEHVLSHQFGPRCSGLTHELETEYSASGALEKLSERLRDVRSALFEPVFREELVEEALLDVETEFNSKAEAEAAQVNQMLYELYADRRHPGYHFRFGNRESLRGVTGEDLARMHRKYFTPKIVTLAVHASLSLAELRRLVKRIFDPVPVPGPGPDRFQWIVLPPARRQLRDPGVASALREQPRESSRDSIPVSIPWVNAEVAGKLVYVCDSAGGGEGPGTVTVTMEFFFEPVGDADEGLALDFIAEVLNHKGRGSLGHWLQRRLAAVTGVASAVVRSAVVDVLQMSVRIAATSEAEMSASWDDSASGSAVVGEFLESVLLYVEAFKRELLAVDVRSLALHAERKARLGGAAEAGRLVHEVARNLWRFPSRPEEAVLPAAGRMRRVRPSMVKSYWRRMGRGNLAVRLAGGAEFLKRHCDRLEPHHQVPYGLEPLPWRLAVRLLRTERQETSNWRLLAELRRRGWTSENVLVSEFDVLALAQGQGLGAGGGSVGGGELAGLGEEVRKRETAEGGVTVYLDRQRRWESGRMRVQVTLFSPWLQNGGLQSYAQAQVVRRCFTRALEAELYPGRVRGVQHSVHVLDTKVTFVFEGRGAEGIGRLVEKYVEAVGKTGEEFPEPELCRETLQDSKGKMGRKVEQMSPMESAEHWLGLLIKDPYFSEWEKRDAVEELDYDRDIDPLRKIFWSQLALGGLFVAGVQGQWRGAEEEEQMLEWVEELTSALRRAAEHRASSEQAIQRATWKVTVQDFETFPDLRQRQVRDITMCRRIPSTRSFLSTGLVALQLYRGEAAGGRNPLTQPLSYRERKVDNPLGRQFLARLMVFRPVLLDLFMANCHGTLDHMQVPTVRLELGASGYAHLIIGVSAGETVHDVMETITNFLEELPRHVSSYTGLEMIKRRLAKDLHNAVVVPAQREFLFFKEVASRVPEFENLLGINDCIPDVTLQHLEELAQQALTAPRVRIAVKHPDDSSMAESPWSDISLRKWKKTRAGTTRTHSLFRESTRSHSANSSPNSSPGTSPPLGPSSLEIHMHKLDGVSGAML